MKRQNSYVASLAALLTLLFLPLSAAAEVCKNNQVSKADLSTFDKKLPLSESARIHAEKLHFPCGLPGHNASPAPTRVYYFLRQGAAAAHLGRLQAYGTGPSNIFSPM
jgi:hypothetical protein